jgi:PLP dependent protein
MEPTDIDIETNLASVFGTIQSTCHQYHRDLSEIRLVAVSKTKPLSLLQHCIDAYPKYAIGTASPNHPVLGENYVQELVDKVTQLSATNRNDQNDPYDHVLWHFIGTLQSNKVSLLLKPFTASSIHRLTVETVTSIKLATKLQNAVSSLIIESPASVSVALETPINSQVDTNEVATTLLPPVIQLKIFIQINTSGEETKGGVAPPSSTNSDLLSLTQHVIRSCPNLQLVGLMAIGAPGETQTFDILRQCRTYLQEKVPEILLQHRKQQPLELSMGMSDDYPDAIAAGATNIRVGSTIFGVRGKK